MSKKIPKRTSVRRDQPSSGLASSIKPKGMSIELSDAQIAQVVRGAGDGGLSMLLSTRLEQEEIGESLTRALNDPLLDDPGISRSLALGWMVFAALAPPGTEHGVKEVGKRLGLSPSTTHRYLKTLAELNLVERTVPKRLYRIVSDGTERAKQRSLVGQ